MLRLSMNRRLSCNERLSLVHRLSLLHWLSLVHKLNLLHLLGYCIRCRIRRDLKKVSGCLGGYQVEVGCPVRLEAPWFEVEASSEPLLIGFDSLLILSSRAFP
ncbi:hypothetical protein CRG98_006836 [Punica granatum]|uniref:Uncharacterized protein n=1 Tax=Punica granatum TaxID=22663 RepID=A0A2I0KWB4_PUNGR|nr:hypothetical protein CRG98_006836 [Punica granatum]